MLVWIHVCVLNSSAFCVFVLFFFFFSRVLAKRDYCSCTVQWTVTANVDFSVANSDHVLFMNPQIPLFSNFFIKNGSHGTIYTFKNYFATVISAISFQFQQNKSYPNRPLVIYNLNNTRWVWFNFLKKWSFQKVWYEIRLFENV